MKGHDAVARALVDQGVDTVFGVLGDGNLFIGENLTREHDVEFVSATHEANAVCMAEGWAKTTGRLGVATVTHGPGLTNTITALVEGVRNRTPMVLVAGDTPTNAKHHLQKIDQAALVAASGAGFEPVRNVTSIAADVATAVRRAHSERRPIVLNVPLEIEWEEVDYVPVPAVERPATALAPDPAGLDEAVGIIASASRPLILAGRGAARSGARESLIRLAEKLGAPVATTLLGSGFFRGDPCDLGIFGTLSHRIAGEAVASADCVITFGASLNVHTTDQGRMLAGKRVVQVDLDPTAIGQTVPINAAVLGDAAMTADTIVDMLDSVDHRPSGFRSDALAAQLSSFDLDDELVDLSRDDVIDPRTATRRLEEMLPADRTVVVDAGRFMLNALTFSVPEPSALVTSHGFAAIGLGMSMAIGAAVGRRDRPTVLGVGDGGFMMGGMTELYTAVHYGLDLIVVLYNDGSYGAEHIQLHRKDMDTSASLHEWPDFVEVAQTLGCAATKVNNVADLKKAADLIDNRVPGQPVLIELTLDPDMISSIASPH
ncbi:MAG: thiamine pyrophosphate-binding protein [Acidimicrobiales bacterium]|jgi:acetolactate synthase-1/2/3 large subunit